MIMRKLTWATTSRVAACTDPFVWNPGPEATTQEAAPRSAGFITSNSELPAGHLDVCKDTDQSIQIEIKRQALSPALKRLYLSCFPPFAAGTSSSSASEPSSFLKTTSMRTPEPMPRLEKNVFITRSQAGPGFPQQGDAQVCLPVSSSVSSFGKFMGRVNLGMSREVYGTSKPCMSREVYGTTKPWHES